MKTRVSAITKKFTIAAIGYLLSEEIGIHNELGKMTVGVLLEQTVDELHAMVKHGKAKAMAVELLELFKSIPTEDYNIKISAFTAEQEIVRDLYGLSVNPVTAKVVVNRYSRDTKLQ